MGFKLFLITILALFLCSSCASDTKWIHPVNSEEQKKQDEDECGWDAVRSADSMPDLGTQGYDPAMIRKMNRQKETMNQCMKERGYKGIPQ
jgi:hypothetical protein